MTGLLDLPAELLNSIFTYLSPEAVFATRRASRKLDQASLSYFGQRFFHKKGYMITTPSLQVLQAIADHPELPKYVQHIWLNPDCFTWISPELAGKDASEGYRECIKDHAELMDVTALARKLTAAFSSLPNLEVIGMRRSEDHRPWGFRQLMDVVGQDPRILGPVPNGPMWALSGPTHLFEAIVHAVAATELKLKRLYTDAVEIDNIRPDLLTQAQLDRACRSLLYLEINCTKAWVEKKHARATYARLKDPARYGRGLVRLLKATPQLKEIGLQIFPDRQQSHMVPPMSHDPESWRQSYQYLCLAAVTSSVQLEHLTRVKIEKFTTCPDTLINFLYPSRASLASLKIRDVRLLSDAEHPQPWKPVFGSLRDHFPSLSYFLLYQLKYSHGGISFVREPPTLLPPSETDISGFPNPEFGGYTEGPLLTDEFFAKYDHIALEARDSEQVRRKLKSIVEEHWYHKPIFSYAMDEGLWHTDTSDEE